MKISWDLVLQGSRLLVPILAQLVQFIVQSRVKNGLFFLKQVKILFWFLVFWWYLIHFNSNFSKKCSFEGKHMPYKMVQNLIQSNGRIKKSTFWPYLVRGLVLMAAKMDFSPFFALKFMILHIYSIFKNFLSLFWCVNRDWIKYSINSNEFHENWE